MVWLKNILKNLLFFLEQIGHITIGKNGMAYGFRVKNEI